MKSILVFFLLSVSLISQSPEHGGLMFIGNSASGNSIHGAGLKSCLDLTPVNKLKFTNDFSLQFDLAMYSSEYSGQIFSIRGNNNFTATLLYNLRDGADCSFLSLSINNKNLGVKIPIDKKAMSLNSWEKFSVVFNLKANKIFVKYGNKQFQLNCPLPDDSEAEVIFGAKVETNIPCFAIRSLCVYGENNNLLHAWKLLESSGVKAVDEKGTATAEVINGKWLLEKHFRWEKINSLSQDKVNPGQVKIDTENGLITFFSSKSHSTYDYRNHKVKDVKEFKNQKPNSELVLIQGAPKQKIYAYSQRADRYFVFDTATSLWTDEKHGLSDSLPGGLNRTLAIQNPINGDLLTLGGLGDSRAKNMLRVMDINSGKMKNLRVEGDIWSPHYSLNYFPSTEQGVFYLFGGQGNETGNQESGFYPMNDLFKLDLRDTTFRKVWQVLPALHINILPSLSPLYFNKSINTFYAVTDTDYRTSGGLTEKFNLCAFSLDNPSYNLIGEELILKNEEFVAEFYDDKGKAFYIATSQSISDSKQNINIYRILTPVMTGQEYAAVTGSLGEDKLKKVWEVGGGLAALGLLSVLYYNIKKKKIGKSSSEPIDKAQIEILVPAEEISLPELEMTAEKPETLIVTGTESGISEVIKDFSIPCKIDLRLFGPFTFLDENGSDISLSFTPKIKEFFILILLHSFRSAGREAKVSELKLADTVWPGQTDKSIRNNKKVTLNKLRILLKAFQGIEIESQGGNLSVILGANVDCDICRIRELLSFGKKLVTENIYWEEFYSITSRGGLLPFCTYEWLESIRIDISEEIISLYLDRIKRAEVSGEYDVVSHLCDTVFLYDHLNEEALEYKVRALHKKGSFTSAHSTYDSFCKSYFTLFGEGFQKEFKDILNHDEI